MQTITSMKTSINHVPALFRSKAFQQHVGMRNADIGGGRYSTASQWIWREYGCRNFVIDPFNCNPEHNAKAIADAKGAETATLSNVLCVINSVDARRAAVNEACCIVNPHHGRVLITCYAGDGSGVGRETRAGWQANRKTADWVDEIRSCPAVGSIVRTGKILTITPRWCD